MKKKKEIQGYIKAVGTQVHKDGSTMFIETSRGSIDLKPESEYLIKEL